MEELSEKSQVKLDIPVFKKNKLPNKSNRQNISKLQEVLILRLQALLEEANKYPIPTQMRANTEGKI